MEYNQNYIEKQVSELRKLQSDLFENNNNKPNISEINNLAEKLIDITKNTYDKICEKYAEIRTLELNEFDRKVWNKLLNYVDQYISKDYKKLKLLDVGTGHGRDLKYALDMGFDAIGVDNSDLFIEGLENLANNNVIPKNCFVKADMRNLPFKDNSFDVVRHNATLLHLPIIEKGYTVDKAIEESYRVLKDKGLLHVLVKKKFF